MTSTAPTSSENMSTTSEAIIESAPSVSITPPGSAYSLRVQHRIKMVEDIWESVLWHECGEDLLTLLHQLRRLCSVEGQAPAARAASVQKVVQVVEDLELQDAIRAARAFALYFQLINSVEQHYEQQGQQRQYRAAYGEVEPSSAIAGLATIRPHQHNHTSKAAPRHQPEQVKSTFDYQMLPTSYRDAGLKTIECTATIDSAVD